MNKLIKQLSNKPSVSVFDASFSTKNEIKKYDFAKSLSITFFNKKGSNNKNDSESIKSKIYTSSDELTQSTGELAILCGKSILNCVAKYPYRSKFVAVEINLFNKYLLLAIVGLLRRILIGKKDPNAKITFLGFHKFTTFSLKFYILFQNPNARVTNHFSISEDIGYEGLLDFLNKLNGKYVVLRFFEKLPAGNREGGDLDILVDDDIFDLVAEFLLSNPGNQMVDMYSVLGPSNAARIPYHTPFLSRKILDEYSIFRGYRVPSKENYLNSFIYHCLYHKGLSSGIPTEYSNLTVSDSPDNDYLKKIHELASEVEVTVGNSLEELDYYMKSVGWKPHTDTLDLLASSNKWIERHLKSVKKEKEITLTICVLKKGFHDKHSLADIKDELKKQGFNILKEEELKDERLSKAHDHLRGGNWSASGDDSFKPSYIFVLFDITKYGYLVRSHSLNYDPRSKKEALRKRFDYNYQSHIHMTDNTHQSYEYLDILYPDDKNSIINEIINYDKLNKFDINVNFVKFKYLISTYPRKFAESLMSTLKNFI